jgi:hypothetical protein
MKPLSPISATATATTARFDGVGRPGAGTVIGGGHSASRSRAVARCDAGRRSPRGQGRRIGRARRGSSGCPPVEGTHGSPLAVTWATLAPCSALKLPAHEVSVGSNAPRGNIDVSMVGSIGVTLRHSGMGAMKGTTASGSGCHDFPRGHGGRRLCIQGLRPRCVEPGESRLAETKPGWAGLAWRLGSSLRFGRSVPGPLAFSARHERSPVRQRTGAVRPQAPRLPGFARHHGHLAHQ